MLTYLDNLSQGTHRFEMGGESIEGTELTLTPQVEGLQEINFQVMPEGIRREVLVPERILELQPTLI